jgi:hypothetical protein
MDLVDADLILLSWVPNPSFIPIHGRRILEIYAEKMQKKLHLDPQSEHVFSLHIPFQLSYKCGSMVQLRVHAAGVLEVGQYY